jgi:hypothetical protein
MKNPLQRTGKFASNLKDVLFSCLCDFVHRRGKPTPLFRCMHRRISTLVVQRTPCLVADMSALW